MRDIIEEIWSQKRKRFHVFFAGFDREKSVLVVNLQNSLISKITFSLGLVVSVFVWIKAESGLKKTRIN
jgi:hypothetical protein